MDKKFGKLMGVAFAIFAATASVKADPGLIQCVDSFTKNPVGKAERWALDTDITTLSAADYDESKKDVTLGTLLGNINTHETVYGVTGKPWRLNEYMYAYYEGYMYLTKGKTYSVFTHYDDGAAVAIEGEYLYNGNQGYDSENWPSFNPYTATYTGWHKIQAMAFQGFGGIGKRRDISVVCGMQWTDVDPDIATNDLDNVEYWHKFVDPGDGSLLVTEAPPRNIAVDSWSKEAAAFNFSLSISEGHESILYACYGDQNYGTNLADWPNKTEYTITSNEQIKEIEIPLEAKYVQFIIVTYDAVAYTPCYDLSSAGLTQVVSQSSNVLDGDKVEINASLQFADNIERVDAYVTYWLAGSDEKQTSEIISVPNGEKFVYILENLIPEKEYNYSITIVDSYTDVTSSQDSFTTLGASDLLSVTCSQEDGRYYTITATVGELGAGDTYLILYTAHTNITDKADDSKLVYSEESVMKIEESSSSYKFENVKSEWGDYFFYKVACSNECAGIIWVDESVATMKNITLDTVSKFKWNTDVSYGYWTNSVNWEKQTTYSDSFIYPDYGAYACFDNCGDVAITSIVTKTIGGLGKDQRWAIPMALHAENLDITFKGEYEGEGLAPIDDNMFRLFVKYGDNQKNLDMKSNSKLTIDNIWSCFTEDLNFHKDSYATNCMLHVTNQGVFDCPKVVRANNLRSRIVLDKQSIAYIYTLELSSTDSALIIDDSAVHISAFLYLNHWSSSNHTKDDGGVPRVFFRGKNPKLLVKGQIRVADDADYGRHDPTKIARPEFIFEIPEGGYDEAPIQRYQSTNNYFLYSSSKTNVLIKVDVENSDAYLKPSSDPTKRDHKLIAWDNGSNPYPLDINKFEFAELPEPERNYYFFTYDNTDAREGTYVTGVWVHLDKEQGTLIIIR